MAVWVKSRGNSIPDGAVRAGYESNGDALFVARHHTPDGYVASGKIGHHLPGAHIPYDGKELIFTEYEALVFPTSEEGFYDWKSCSNGEVPEKAVATDETSRMFVGRYYFESKSLVPGKVFTKNKVCYVSFDGKEWNDANYEVLYRVK